MSLGSAGSSEKGGYVWSGERERRETYPHEFLDLALLEARLKFAGFGLGEAGQVQWLVGGLGRLRISSCGCDLCLPFHGVCISSSDWLLIRIGVELLR